ncbi:MAG: ABC transporter ATP-binding protein [Bacteroidota bacterium]
MIRIHQLSFGYKKKQRLFEQLMLKAPEGNIYGLLGKNGAGKTTLLKLITGLLHPKEGSIEVLGADPAKRQVNFLQDIFYIPEEFATPSLSLPQFEKAYSPFYPKFDPDQFQTYLKEFNIPIEQNMDKMSFGQKKKVMLSFGLASNSRLLILDEPTNGLDIPSKGQLRRVLANSISPERTFFISTHQVRDISNLIDPVIILDSGKVIFHETIENIMSKLYFSLDSQVENTPEVIHYERLPGGYSVVSKNSGNHMGGEVDLEILFNAVLANNQTFTEIFSEA